MVSIFTFYDATYTCANGQLVFGVFDLELFHKTDGWRCGACGQPPTCGQVVGNA